MGRSNPFFKCPGEGESAERSVREKFTEIPSFLIPAKVPLGFISLWVLAAALARGANNVLQVWTKKRVKPGGVSS